LTDAPNVAVIVVPDANPEGAWADAIHTFVLPVLPCLSIVHVNDPPATLDNVVTVEYQPPQTTMKPPDATVAPVLNAIVANGPLPRWFPPSVSRSMTIAI
jgi:hypothetical protein